MYLFLHEIDYAIWLVFALHAILTVLYMSFNSVNDFEDVYFCIALMLNLDNLC